MAFPLWALILLALTPSLAGAGSASSNSTEKPSLPENSTTEPPPEPVDEIAASIIINALNVSKIMYEASGYILRDVINETLRQVGSWGMPVTTIGIKNFANKWDLLTLFFYSGRRFERLVQSLKKEPAATNKDAAFKAVFNAFNGLLSYGLNLTTNGLGYPAAKPADQGTGSVYFLVPMTGGVPPWEGAPKNTPPPSCTGTRVIRNQPFKSFNVEVQFERSEPVVVIAYATAHLGIDISNCPAIIEHHGNKALLFNSSSYIRSFSSNNSLVYPILHLSLDQHNIDRLCTVKVCSIREDHQALKGRPTPVKPELLTIELVGQKQHLATTRRKLLSISDSTLKARCGSGTKVVSAIRYDINTPEQPRTGPYKTVCNGTKILHGYAPPDLGCYSFTRHIAKVQCPTTESAVTKEAGDCSYKMSADSCPDGLMCITVNTPGRGSVHAASNGFKAMEDCNKECTFNIPGPEATITCPNGEKHAIKSARMPVACPMHKYASFPLWICRMSFHPEYIYILISWYFLGYALWRALLLTICALLSSISLAIRKLRLMGDATRGYCEQCSEWVPSKYHWQRHENCRNGRCPYCMTTMSSEKLKAHPKTCLPREQRLQEDEEAVTVKLIPFFIRASIVFMTAMAKTFSKAAWVLGLIVFFYMSIHPVYSIRDTEASVDLWQDEVDFVNFCDIGCVQGQEECTCINRGQTGRRLLGLFENLKKVSKFLNETAKNKKRAGTKSMKRAIDVLAPWGTLHVSDTYQPSYSGSHISLSWTETSSSDDHIILNGKSEAIMKLEPGTGVVWEITSPKSTEQRRVFVSILDFTQVYTTKFLFTTGDRTIETWMHGRCTGDCPDKCGCDSPLCMFNKYDDFTNWRCNPTWCWSIGQGCACCALGIKSYFTHWLASKWELNYVETLVLACVETSPDDRVCQQVAAGTTIQLGPVSVQFSDPTGVENKLPKDVMIFHKSPKQDSFDLIDKLVITDGRSVCDVQSCTHGPVGDLQVFDPTAFFDKDHVNVNSIGGRSGLNESNAWFSWSGTNSYYTCHPGNWPDCHSTGVVDTNAEAFDNLFKTGDVSNNWYFHAEKLHIAGHPTLNLKGRPSYGSGQLTALLDVQGLILKSVKVKPEGLHLDLSGCMGCFACTTGFTCSVRVRITHPEQYGLHLMSLDSDVVVPSVTIMAQSDTTVSHEMHFFSITDKKNFCVRVREEDASTGVVKACTSVSLTPPAAVLLEHRVTLHSTSNPNCTAGYFTCVAANASSFFSGLGELLTRAFGSLWGGIVSVVVIGVLILLLIFFGPSIFLFLANCCKYKRGYRRVIEFDSINKEWKEAQQLVREEKKRSRAAEDLLLKLSKTK